MARVIEFGPGCDIPAARRRPSASEERGLAYDAEVRAATDQLYAEVKDFITPMEWPAVAPLVYHINRLKKAKNAFFCSVTLIGVSNWSMGSIPETSLRRRSKARSTSLTLTIPSRLAEPVRWWRGGPPPAGRADRCRLHPTIRP